jgi:hypothetical protein
MSAANEPPLDHPLTVASLEEAGWVGTDASLEHSLFEYDFAWRESEDGDIVFLYRVRGNQFDSVALDPKINLYKEYSWCSKKQWESFYDLHGTTMEEWDELPFPHKMYDLYHAHGYDNIFGGSYGALFTIIDPQAEVWADWKPAEEPTRYFLWHEQIYINPNGNRVFSMQGRYSLHSRILRRKATRLRPLNCHCAPIWEDYPNEEGM